MTRALVPLLALLCSCGGSPVVTRIVGAETVPGRFIDPDAYAAFFRGAAAEEQGKWAEALAAYEQARSLDDDDAEIWTRIGVVRCRAKPGDGRDAFVKALAVDPEYGPAHLGLAACGGDEGGVSLASRAEPRAIEPQLWLSRLEKGQERLVALTLARPSATAWDALATYAAAKGNPWLAVSASAAAAARDDSRAAAAAERSAELAGDGELGAARALAGILLDARGRRGAALKVPPLVARLGVDEALERADADRAVARAASAHMGLDEVGARALLLGQPEIASKLAALVADADPTSAGAQVVRAAADEALGRTPHAIQLSRTATVPGSVAIVYGRALARTTTGASDALRALRHEPLRAGDALETNAAVDLAARGVLADTELPPDAQLELAVRRRAPFPDAAAAAARDPKSTIDVRHRFLFFAWTAPTGQDSARLADRLTRSGSRDPLVGSAVMHIASATGKSIDQVVRDRLAASAPADPIVWATLVDAQSSEPSRRRLAAVAATKAERDLSRF